MQNMFRFKHVKSNATTTPKPNSVLINVVAVVATHS
jgi:hypothetical protein